MFMKEGWDNMVDAKLFKDSIIFENEDLKKIAVEKLKEKYKKND